MATIRDVLAGVYARRDWAGDCYEAAATAMLELHMASRSRTARVVHGEPVGRGGSAGRSRFGHAWIEVGKGVDRVVYDLTVRAEPFEPSEFYRLGTLDEDNVRRYSFEEARKWMLDTEHYGPWQGPFAAPSMAETRHPDPHAGYEDDPMVLADLDNGGWGTD